MYNSCWFSINFVHLVSSLNLDHFSSESWSVETGSRYLVIIIENTVPANYVPINGLPVPLGEENTLFKVMNVFFRSLGYYPIHVNNDLCPNRVRIPTTLLRVWNPHAPLVAMLQHTRISVCILLVDEMHARCPSDVRNLNEMRLFGVWGVHRLFADCTVPGTWPLLGVRDHYELVKIIMAGSQNFKFPGIFLPHKSWELRGGPKKSVRAHNV